MPWCCDEARPLSEAQCSITYWCELCKHSSLNYIVKNFKIVRESFSAALGIIDRHGDITTSSQGKRHGHPMVIIGVYLCRLQKCGRSDDTEIPALFNPYPKLSQLRHYCIHSFRLFYPPIVHISNRCWPLSKDCCYCKAHSCIWDVIAIMINALQMPPWRACRTDHVLQQAL